MGASYNEPSSRLTTEARDTMLATTGVNLTSVGFRDKFVFATEIGRVEKAQYELAAYSVIPSVSINVLIRGGLVSGQQ